ncbi:MAG: DNA polymerase III subunit gamma/tau [Thermodesulfobacteriota bacterium]
MAYLVLARKYRPQTFEDVVAQPQVTATLQNAITQNRVAHAMCFSGPRGTGKTTVARIFAKAMNCEQGPTTKPCNQCSSCREITAGTSVDVFEIDGASNNSVDQVRELRENVKYAPAASPYKIYIIDEVHMLSTAAFNALLKTLEEPPGHVLFVMATTEPHKIPVTILSRCQRYDFARIALSDIVSHLTRLCEKESFSLAEDSLFAVARASGGCMRDALSLLDQVMACSDGGASLEAVLQILGVADKRDIAALAAALLSRDMASALALTNSLYNRGHDLKRLFSDLTEHFRNLLVAQSVPEPGSLLDIPASEAADLSAQAASAEPGMARYALLSLMKDESQVRFAAAPRLAFEAALLRACEMAPAVSMDRVVERLDALYEYVKGKGPAPVRAVPPAAEAAVAPRQAPEAPKPLPETPRPAEQEQPPPPPLRVREPEPEPMDAAHSDPPPPGPEGPAPDLSAWPKFLSALADVEPLLSAQLALCSPREIAGASLVIETPQNGAVLDYVTTPESRKELAAALHRFFGRKLSVTFEARKEAPKQAAEAEEDPDWRNKAVNHPLVTEALDIFKANIVDIKKL